MAAKRILTLLLLALSCVAVYADDEREYDRERYVREIRNYKHEYLADKLRLSREQQQAFFALYDAMEDEIMSLNAQTRAIERRINDDRSAGEAEVLAAADSIYSRKAREAEIEGRYYRQFKQKLTPRQLVRLKEAERGFNRQLMRQHRRSKH